MIMYKMSYPGSGSVHRDNVAVLGQPKYLDRPNYVARMPNTLEGVEVGDFTLSDRDPYPNPRNFHTKYTSQNAFADYVYSEKMKQKSFNYFKPDFQAKSYTDNLFSEYGAGLTAEQTQKAQAQLRGVFAGMQPVQRPAQ